MRVTISRLMSVIYGNTCRRHDNTRSGGPYGGSIPSVPQFLENNNENY
jgi:hypothetical protein